jgi:hypothetical protein
MLASTNNNNGVGNNNSAEPPLTPARSFLVGQDRAGHWIAVEPHGLAGGIFISRKAALDYAAFESDHRPGAVMMTAGPVDLML